ncbi:hypothetical protein V0R37_00045 [Pollutimonas sp. H1-120]|uniref:hypothetical protein n=1 Tax=Pollutimonas sp. H1-120 TaxID=3148824 RepID=UPI003B522AD3
MDDDAGCIRAARGLNQKTGASMHYIILILAAMLMGTAIGALLVPRNKSLFIGSLAAIALGAGTMATGSWILLAIGTAIFLAAQATQRDNASLQA